MKIGVPKEIYPGERRVATTPEVVKQLAKLGYDVAVQGNLDPAALLGPFAVIESKTNSIIECTNGRPGHIFNLGH